MNRPSIPIEIERMVKVEAGHRCAIPTCKQPQVELHHITPYADTQDDSFENLIALCPNCHTRVHRGEIDTKSVKKYKSNLSLLNSRYNTMERRVLKKFASEPELEEIPFPTGFEILLEYLIADGFLEKSAWAGVRINNVPVHEDYRLTQSGREFVDKLRHGVELD